MSAPDPKDIREIFASETAEWSDIRNERATDMRCVAGDPWKPSERKAREDLQRPVLSLDELGQYHNQIINDVRANPRGMQFSPTGNGANDKGARFYENKARETEYRSQAQVAYTTAFANCIEGSYGFVRVSTKYIHGEFFDDQTPADLTLFNQELWIESIPNPDMVLPDSRALRPDLRDQKRCFVMEQWATTDVERRFGKDAVRSLGFLSALRATAPWVQKGTQQIAEYWDKAQTGIKRRLLHLKPNTEINPAPQPIAAYEDGYRGMDLKPSSDDIVTHRDIEQFAITQYLTNGFDILETKAWAGKYIPIAACLGKILYVPQGGETKRVIMSLTRLARDPYMLYCYYRTQQAEMAGMIPKAPVIGYKGQFKGMADKWAAAPHEPLAFLEAHGITEATGNQVLPLPTRLAYEAGAHLQALELVAEGARRAIQAAMNVSPMPTDANRISDLSKVAMDKLDATVQKGAYHFVDHYDTMIETVGVYFEDLCDKVHDTMGKTGVRQADGKSKIVAINDPHDPEAITTKGDYLVTVTAGPTNASERAAADVFVSDIAKNIGAIAEIAGPQAAKKILGMSIRLKDLGSEGDAVADVIDPPPPDGSKPPTPEMQALQQENQQLKAHVQQQDQAIATKQIEFAAQKDIESMRLDKTAALQIKIKEMEFSDKDKDRAAKIEAARISAAKGAIDPVAAAIEEHIALGTDLAHTSMEAERDRQHEKEMAALDHAHTLTEAEQAASHGMIATQQQADLAPPPTGA